jgi:membrane fusion protein, multidrug efflux system
MSKLNAKQQGTAVVTGISSGIVSDTARRRLVEWGFFARRTPSRHFLLVCMCAVSVAISLAGCRQSPDKKSFSPAAVEVAAVVPKPIHLSDEFNGRVASINSVDVRARVTGYVDNVAYREGDSVKRGDPLFVIDPRPYRDALDSAKASLEREKAAAAFANIQAKRAQTLNAYQPSPAHARKSCTSRSNGADHCRVTKPCLCVLRLR